jgi:hypothetical protein
MKRVILLMIGLMVIFLAPVQAMPQAAEMITGGCKSQMGNLEKDAKKKIEKIKKSIGKSGDFRILAELYTFLQEDPSHKQNARPLIQEVLGSVTQKSKIVYEETYNTDARSLLKFYTSPEMYPEFSYEGSLCREIEVKIARILLERLDTRLMSYQELSAIGENPDAYYSLLATTTKAVNTIASTCLSDMVNRSLDLCAKKQYWEFAERLVEGQVYPEIDFFGGIDKNEEAVNILEKAYTTENEKIIIPQAERVIGMLQQNRGLLESPSEKYEDVKLGLTVDNLNSDSAKQYGFTSFAKVIVVDIVKDGYAAKAGIQIGDAITAIANKIIKNVKDFKRNLVNQNGKPFFPITIVRGDKEFLCMVDASGSMFMTPINK